MEVEISDKSGTGVSEYTYKESVCDECGNNHKLRTWKKTTMEGSQKRG